MNRRTVVTVVALVAAVAAGIVLGQRAVIVSGRSMLPDARTGDIVLVWPADTYRVGDAAVFEVPEGQAGAGARVYHRIVDERDGSFVFQGDNNPFPDPWAVDADDVVGREVVRIPRLGLLVPFLRQPAALAALAAGLAAAWAASRTVGQANGDDDDDDDDAGRPGDRRGTAPRHRHPAPT